MNKISLLFNMINQKLKKVINDKIAKSKQRFKEYFSMESSVGHLMEVSRNFNFISIGINEIHNGLNPNSNRFQLSYLHIIYFGIFTIFLNLFSFTNYYHYLKLNFLPDNFKINMIVYAIGFTWILGAKIDMILAEIKSNLKPFKVFYYLIHNIKFKHKLTDLNYNRLAIWSRIIQIGVLDYGTVIMETIAIGLIILIAILSQKFMWILLSICFVSALFIGCVNFSCWICIVFILCLYYKIRFNQIHLSIKSIVLNGDWNDINKIIKIINKRTENRLINLIKEHENVSNEIHQLNLMIRRAAGGLAIFFIIDRIIVIYLLINYNNNVFVIVMLLCQFLILFIFGFAITYLCSRQIKSAHQSYKLIYSILCKSKIRLQFRFKVIKTH